MVMASLGCKASEDGQEEQGHRAGNSSDKGALCLLCVGLKRKGILLDSFEVYQ